MSLTSSIPIPNQCGYCGNYHVGLCPRIKVIEYHPNGTVKRVEFYDSAPSGGSEETG